jgi:hypothetical protein
MAVFIAPIHLVGVELDREWFGASHVAIPPRVPSARDGHRLVGGVHLHREMQRVGREVKALHGESAEGPRRTERHRDHPFALLLPRMIAGGPVDRMRRVVERKLVALTLEVEAAVTDATRPWRHREAPEVVGVDLGCDQEIEAVHGERHDAAALLRRDHEPRRPGLEREHARQSRTHPSRCVHRP